MKPDDEPNIIIPTPIEEPKKKQLAASVQRFFGCLNCEWKGTICPHGLKKKSDKHIGRDEGKWCHIFICNDRRKFLLGLLDPKKRYSDFKDYRQDIMLALESGKYLQYTARLNVLEGNLDKEKNKDKKQDLRQERDILYNKVHNIGERVLKYDDKHRDRVTPKELKVTEEKKLTFEQVNRIIYEGEQLEQEEIKKKKRVEIYA